MDRQIINFSANEQSLIRTGGTDHYAGNIVRYIEAHFDFGANWTGYDSVRAIWRNKRDVTRYSTVLNSEGVCIVPFEALTMRGDVCMNLVGSIVEDDVLVDRLTTYPICALTVDVPAMVDGSDPASITPSEYEQFVASVRNDANRAEAGAESAEASASEASASAEQATLSAQASEASALRASGYASDAQTSERNASEYAQDAHISAQNAETFALDAEEAKRKILSMRAEATTLAEGSQATASYSDGVLTLGIPKGDTGARGEKGETGETGATPNLSIGTVETLEPTESATASITGTAENPVLNLGLPQGRTGEVTYEDLESILPRDTATGNPVTITDGQSVIPVKSLEVELEPIQDLHGYDKPWVGGAGKNKFDKEYLSNFANYTLTIGSYKYTDKIQLKPNTNYVIVATNKTAMSSALYYVLYHVEGSDPDKITPISSEFLYPVYDGRVSQDDNYTKFTTGETGVIRFGVANATALAEIMSTDWQLEEGSTATSWTPYSNICPISGHTECVTEVSGKNLLDPQSITVGKFYNDTLTEVTHADKAHSDFIKIKANTSYCLNGFAGRSFYSMLALDANKQPITTWYGGASKTAPFVATTPSNAYYMVLNFNADQVGTIAFYESTTVDGYIPYQGTSYHTTLGRTVYGGTLDVVSGELVVDRAMVDLGTLTWSRYTPSATNIPVFYASVSGMLKANEGASLPLCSSYRCEAWTDLSRREDGTLQPHPTLALIYVADSRFEDVSQFASAMNGVQLVYELANPQTVQLTPQQVMLLTGDNNLWSDGDITMVYSADVQRWVEKKLNS